MKRLMLVFWVVFSFIWVLTKGSIVIAAGPTCSYNSEICYQTSECAYHCAFYQNCSYSCSGMQYYNPPGDYEGCCVWTQDNYGQGGYSCGVNEWSAWSACVNGYQSRT